MGAETGKRNEQFRGRKGKKEIDNYSGMRISIYVWMQTEGDRTEIILLGIFCMNLTSSISASSRIRMFPYSVLAGSLECQTKSPKKELT